MAASTDPDVDDLGDAILNMETVIGKVARHLDHTRENAMATQLRDALKDLKAVIKDM